MTASTELIRKRLATLAIAASTLAVACAGTPGTPAVRQSCGASSGEFGETDCALLDGVAIGSLSGQPLVGITLRIDSAVAGVGYVYVSNAVRTATDGKFSLTVSRINRLRALTDPDTVTLELKAFTTSSGRPGDQANAAAAVQVRFSPSGQIPTSSVVTARLALPD